MSPPQFTSAQRQRLDYCMTVFNNDVLAPLLQILRGEFGISTPPSIAQLQERLKHAQGNLAGPNAEGTHVVSGHVVPFLKRCILYVRRKEVSEVETLKKKVRDPGIFSELDNRISVADMFRNDDWFIQTTPEKMPRLTDYVTMQHAERIEARMRTGQGLPETEEPEKEYDSKFGILRAPDSVDRELAYWRHKCELRETPLALVYLDIDNFKSEFNRYTETVVDRNCLPVIMREIEAHVFYHGLAYHEGGDEFVILLPNAQKDDAIEFMNRLRLKLPNLPPFVGVPAKARISIGICHFHPDCLLTDAEVRQKANDAKKYAKEKGGKDCIVTYRGERYTEDELSVEKPDERRTT
jgi:diguanylate cyclase (GGDEF)-like protein